MSSRGTSDTQDGPLGVLYRSYARFITTFCQKIKKFDIILMTSRGPKAHREGHWVSQ